MLDLCSVVVGQLDHCRAIVELPTGIPLFKKNVKLSGSNEPGLYISDAYSNEVVTVASKSMFEIGSATNEVVRVRE